MDRGFLRLSSAVEIKPDSTLELVIDRCRIRAEALTCEHERDGAFTITCRRVYGAQGAVRYEPRIAVDLSAVLRYPGCDHLFARIIDMSQSGLGFELPAPVRVGTRVCVHFACGIAFGEIRHCTENTLVYRAGMRIDEFIVRRDVPRSRSAAIMHRRWWPPHARRFRITQRLLLLRRLTLCFLVGHGYGWFNDVQGRAVLRCRRCEKVLCV